MSQVLEELGAIVRPFTEDDVSAISKIEASVYEDPWSENLIRESLTAPMTFTMAVFKENKCLAYAVYQVIFTEGHLLNLAVERDSQGKHIGTELLDLVLKDAKKMGAASLFLEVRPSNIVGKRLYEKRGFRTLLVRDAYYSNGEAAVVMVLDRL